MNIATIDRNPRHSPQMQENDAAIMRCIEKELASMGVKSKKFGENEDIPPQYTVILHMSRTQHTLARLEKLEAQGTVVINTPRAVRNCSRRAMVELLHKNNIPQPEYKIISNKEELPPITHPQWIKKGEGWSCIKEDIAYVTTEAEAGEAFDTIRANGCNNVVLCRHIEGDIVKFYGIGNSFFKHHYPCVEKTKFGLEKINGVQQKYPFDATRLQNTAFAAAAALQLDIFGGDAIVTPQGEIYIIDINDFPSFSAIREEAAREIARLLIQKTEKPL